MTLIVSSKTEWLRRLGVTGEWPMAGLPKVLHLDGVSEFFGAIADSPLLFMIVFIERGCAQRAI